MTRILPALITAFSISSYLWHSSPEHSAMWRFQRWCNPHSCGKKNDNCLIKAQNQKRNQFVLCFQCFKSHNSSQSHNWGPTPWHFNSENIKRFNFYIKNCTLYLFCLSFCHVIHSVLCALMQIQTKASISSLALTWRSKDLHKTPLEVNRPWQAYKCRTKS